MKGKLNLVEFNTSNLSNIDKQDVPIKYFLSNGIPFEKEKYDQWAKEYTIKFAHINVYDKDLDINSWISGINNLWPAAKLRAKLLYDDILFTDKVFQDLIVIDNIDIETRYDNNYIIEKELLGYYEKNNIDYTFDNIEIASDSTWYNGYKDICDSSWPECKTPEEFVKLPEYIREECINVHNFSDKIFYSNNNTLIYQANNKITLIPKGCREGYVYRDNWGVTVDDLNTRNKVKDGYLSHYGCDFIKLHQFVDGKIYQCPVSIISNKINPNLSITESYQPLEISDTEIRKKEYFKHRNSIGSVIPQCVMCVNHNSLQDNNIFIRNGIKYVNETYNDNTQAIEVRLNHQMIFYEKLRTDVKNIVIFMHDKFVFSEDDGEYGWYREPRVSETLSKLHRYCYEHSEQNFILITENFYVENELSNLSPSISNLHILSSPHYWFQKDRGLTTLPIVNEKNQDTTSHVICLTGTIMDPRIILILYLMYKGVDKYAHLSLMSYERKNQIPTKRYYDNDYDLKHFYQYIEDEDIKNELIRLNETLDDYPFVREKNFKTGKNFLTHLHSLYSNSYIEIIQESTYMEPSAEPSEKFVYCMYAKNIPIFIGTAGMAQVYKDLGFDIFEDIIDHSYDFEQHPFKRIQKAIDDNIKILTDRNYAIEIWNKNQHRFDKNIDLFHKFYEIEITRTKDFIHSNLV